MRLKSPFPNFPPFRRAQVVDFHPISKTAGAFDFTAINKGNFWVTLITFLYVDMMDTTGTLYSMAKFIGFGECQFPTPVGFLLQNASSRGLGRHLL